jgi:hypothetical protein
MNKILKYTIPTLLCFTHLISTKHIGPDRFHQPFHLGPPLREYPAPPPILYYPPAPPTSSPPILYYPPAPPRKGRYPGRKEEDNTVDEPTVTKLPKLKPDQRVNNNRQKDQGTQTLVSHIDSKPKVFEGRATPTLGPIDIINQFKGFKEFNIQIQGLDKSIMIKVDQNDRTPVKLYKLYHEALRTHLTHDSNYSFLQIEKILDGVVIKNNEGKVIVSAKMLRDKLEEKRFNPKTTIQLQNLQKQIRQEIDANQSGLTDENIQNLQFTLQGVELSNITSITGMNFDDLTHVLDIQGKIRSERNLTGNFTTHKSNQRSLYSLFPVLCHISYDSIEPSKNTCDYNKVTPIFSLVEVVNKGSIPTIELNQPLDETSIGEPLVKQILGIMQAYEAAMTQRDISRWLYSYEYDYKNNKLNTGYPSFLSGSRLCPDRFSLEFDKRSELFFLKKQDLNGKVSRILMAKTNEQNTYALVPLCSNYPQLLELTNEIYNTELSHQKYFKDELY